MPWTRGELGLLFGELMTRHYDPLYARSQGGHLAALPEASHVSTASLDDAHIDHVARRIVGGPD